MKSLTEHLWFEVPGRRGFINITPKSEELVQRSGVTEGLCLINAMHITASILLAITIVSAAAPVAAETIVEFSMDKAPLAGLTVGTCDYGPTDLEKPFHMRLSEEGQSTIQTKPGELGDAAEVFTLRGHQGEFVSWLGIVRHITRIGWPHHGRLLVQNTYFGGFTDCHTQTVEINGGGDFEAEVSALPDEIIPLVLVRVYGVVREENQGQPVIDTDYVRVWHFLQFNFMDFGVDHSNPEWRKRIKLPPDEMIYHIGVSRKYYEERLGPMADEWHEIEEFHRHQTVLEFEREGLEPLDLSPTYQPTEWEKDYFEVIPENERVTVRSKQGEPHASTFGLTGHLDRRVSWFGIVREVTPNGIGRRGGALLIENKYFKGTGDEKLQTVSIRGGGNFLAEVTNLSEELAPLLLVRVYGRVVRDENGVPVVKVKFLRGWHIGQYNFDDYGEDQTDPRWIQDIHLKPGEDVHQNTVSAEYYINRLGTSGEQSEKIKKHFEWQKEWKETELKLQESPPEEVKVEP